MNEYTIKPLGPHTWDDFARLIERQGNASFGAPGCWCLWFHPRDAARDPEGENGRFRKERLVKLGQAHAALVFAQSDIQGPGELVFDAPVAAPRTGEGAPQKIL